MTDNIEKPTAEAKALSLFLMALKSTNSSYKEKSNRISKLWNQVKDGQSSSADYMVEVQKMLKEYGGYTEVIWKTVKHYINKTGEWTLKGDDKYCVDAQEIADKILKK